MKISCIIIDDEPVARKGIENYIKKIDFLDLCGSYSSTEKIAAAALANIELIFLDIKIHKSNGLEFYRNLKAGSPFAIVISAYPEYALEGFELSVTDYLLKPVSFDRFFQAVTRVKELVSLKQQQQLVYETDSEYFFIKCDNKIQKLKYDEVLYIESLSNYVVIYTASKKYLSYLSLNILLDNLPLHKFVRTHKSFIVSIDKVDAVKNNEVSIGNHSLPLGKSYREAFMRLIEKKMIKK
jgi:two-component system, LytTR family, response regulator